jgi:flagellar FliJ protein
MKKFRFQLDPILRLRRNQRELRLQMLADVLRQDGELIALRQQVETERGQQIAELRELGSGGGMNVDASASRRYYAGQLSGDIGQIERRRELIARQIAACRQELIRADQAVKSLEKLAEKRLAEFAAAEERREAIEVEETWRALHAGETPRC